MGLDYGGVRQAEGGKGGAFCLIKKERETCANGKNDVTTVVRWYLRAPAPCWLNDVLKASAKRLCTVHPATDQRHAVGLSHSHETAAGGVRNKVHSTAWCEGGIGVLQR